MCSQSGIPYQRTAKLDCYLSSESSPDYQTLHCIQSCRFINSNRNADLCNWLPKTTRWAENKVLFKPRYSFCVVVVFSNPWTLAQFLMLIEQEKFNQHSIKHGKYVERNLFLVPSFHPYNGFLKRRGIDEGRQSEQLRELVHCCGLHSKPTVA